MLWECDSAATLKYCEALEIMQSGAIVKDDYYNGGLSIKQYTKLKYFSEQAREV